MINNQDWLAIAKRLQAIAQSGLYFTESQYDRDRYQEISDISVDILHKLTDEPIEKINALFASERDGYQTPKVDIRAVIFNEQGEILLVKEKADGKWALPGGWADVGCTPKEVAIKEVREETGLIVSVLRVLAIMDKRCHPHPIQPWYVYKIFILCEKTSGELYHGTTETSAVAYFDKDHIPELSEDRNTAGQIKLMFDFYNNQQSEIYLD
jgi:ADP-ribose pyrophosphatase YjhB (NUDIX family)